MEVGRTRRGALRSFRRLGLRLVAVKSGRIYAGISRACAALRFAPLIKRRCRDLTAWPCAPLPACSACSCSAHRRTGRRRRPIGGRASPAPARPTTPAAGRRIARAIAPLSRDEPLDDLRPDAMPMRSDEMIAAMDAAIAKYQQIADNGGWPIIPPGRMMREGEDDERVPLLRRRLQMSGDLAPRQRRLQLLYVRQRSRPTPCAATSAAMVCVRPAASSARPIPR